MPMVVLEAWALGVPVIASRIGGLAEMLGEDERGVGFRPGDVSDLVAAVGRLRSDPPLASQIIERARESLARHQRSVTLSQLEQIYRSVTR
jgi:glycosyltransferase involved in cell wall biosynthesis